MQERLELARRLGDAEAVASSHDRHRSGSSRARRPRASSSGVHGERGACARRRLHLVSRDRHRQPGRSPGGAGRLRAGEGSPRGKPTNSSVSSATREWSCEGPRQSRHPRGSRGQERRGRGAPASRVSSTPRRWSTRSWRSGAWESWPALALSKGDAERAARLTGAMETLREETGHAPSARSAALERTDEKRARVRARRGAPRRCPRCRSRDDVRAGHGLRPPNLGDGYRRGATGPKSPGGVAYRVTWPRCRAKYDLRLA